MEKLMQYVWEHKLWIAGPLRTDNGQRISILNEGLRNHGPGPDFFKACVSIDGQQWVGDIEIHVRASDWLRHGHDGDPAYDSVVLHVVGNSDCRIRRRNGEEIPQLTMPCAPDFLDRYNAMVNNPFGQLPCAKLINTVPKIYISDWIQALAYERLYQKTDHILKVLGDCHGDWRNTAYIVTARALGFSTNAEPFERVATALPLATLMKHRDMPEMIEGALFGMAGLLDDPRTAGDPYVERMRQEFKFMCAKYRLTPPQSLNWKMSGIRPHNSPLRRLATLAEMIMYNGFALADRAPQVNSVDEARALFDFELRGYWARRFNFGGESAVSMHALSETSVNLLIINVIVPLMYAYGLQYGRDDRCERAAEIWQQLKPEANMLTKVFTAVGFECRDAFTSQALIQLHKAYCAQRKCMYCRIGHRLLAQQVRP